MLAAVALATGTTIIIKMGKPNYLWVTAAPMVWLVISTYTAAYQRIFHPDPRIGFLATANDAAQKLMTGAPPEQIANLQTIVYNNRLDAAIGIVLLVVISLIVLEAMRQWYLLLAHKKTPDLRESLVVPSRLTPLPVAGGED